MSERPLSELVAERERVAEVAGLLEEVEQIEAEAFARYVWERDERKELWIKIGAITVSIIAAISAGAACLQAWYAAHPPPPTTTIECKGGK